PDQSSALLGPIYGGLIALRGARGTRCAVCKDFFSTYVLSQIIFMVDSRKKKIRHLNISTTNIAPDALVRLEYRRYLHGLKLVEFLVKHLRWFLSDVLCYVALDAFGFQQSYSVVHIAWYWWKRTKGGKSFNYFFRHGRVGRECQTLTD
ncbi:hypothetical protein SFRURICE_003993, partial [Spodoptera frugiperda]